MLYAELETTIENTHLNDHRGNETTEDLYEDGRPCPEAKVAENVVERMDIGRGREEDGDQSWEKREKG